MIKTLYTVFIAVLIATFVGVGISAFYTSPQSPQPVLLALTPISPTTSQSAQYVKQQQISLDQQKTFALQIETYNKNVSIISLAFALTILILSLTLIKNLPFFTDGVLFGGVLTLIYSTFRGFSSDDDKFRFVMIALTLVATLILGFIKGERKYGHS